MRGRGAALRAADLALAMAALVLLSPGGLAAGCAALVAFGRAFYAERRIGRGGRPFLHVKFRTMRDGPRIGRSYLEAARVPPLFRLLRACHADEYPELLLVLAGKLSLVGPRPLPARVLAGCLARPSADRHAPRPGLTGLAQVKLGRRGMLSSASQFALDAAWARRGGWVLYWRILAATLDLARRRARANDDPAATAYRRALGSGRG